MSTVYVAEETTVPRTMPPDLLPVGRVFTTGSVAKICKVAPRTVSKWFDSGLLKGYRIPGSNDRRIPEADLLVFMRARGLPVPVGLLPARALAFGLPEAVPGTVVCPTAYDLGREAFTSRVSAIVVGDIEGSAAMATAAGQVRVAWPECRIVAVLSEDAGETFAGVENAFTFRRPGVDWAGVAEAVRAATVAAPGPLVQHQYKTNGDLVAVPRGGMECGAYESVATPGVAREAA